MVENTKIKAFWEKCVENRTMSEYALKNGHLNVAASRFYYALFLGFCSLFEKKGIPVPEDTFRDGRIRKNPYPGTWPRKELHEQAGLAFPDYKIDIEELLWIAFRLRVRADYKAIPVGYDEIAGIKKNAEGLFEVLENEIKKNQ